MKEGDKYMTAPDNRDLTKPKVAPFSNSWRTGADKKGSITMNEKTAALIKSIAAAKAAERDFKEVNAAASATITEANKVMTDTIPADRVEEITREAAELLPDTNMVVVWVSNGSECACASSVFFPNIGTSDTTWVLGSARLDEISAEYTVKLLADAGALEYIDSDTETDIFSDEFEEAKEDDTAPDVPESEAKYSPEELKAMAISTYLGYPEVISDIKKGGTTATEAAAAAASVIENAYSKGAESEVELARVIKEYMNNPEVKAEIKEGKLTAAGAVLEAKECWERICEKVAEKSKS